MPVRRTTSSSANASLTELKQSSTSRVLATIGTHYLSSFREGSCCLASGLLFILHHISTSTQIEIVSDDTWARASRPVPRHSTAVRVRLRIGINADDPRTSLMHILELQLGLDAEWPRVVPAIRCRPLKELYMLLQPDFSDEERIGSEPFRPARV